MDDIRQLHQVERRPALDAKLPGLVAEALDFTTRVRYGEKPCSWREYRGPNHNLEWCYLSAPGPDEASEPVRRLINDPHPFGRRVELAFKVHGGEDRNMRLRERVHVKRALKPGNLRREGTVERTTHREGPADGDIETVGGTLYPLRGEERIRLESGLLSHDPHRR